MNRQFRTLSLIGLCAVLAFQQAATALAQNGPPPKDRYIIVLKPTKNGVPELTDHDITAGGGQVEYKVPGRVQVTLPEQAVDAIRKHGGVKYIQNVILGPVPDASAPAELRLPPTTSSLHVAAEATPPTWKSGTYQYDTSGNIYAIGGVTGDGSTVTHRYAYDELSRLKQSDTITATTQTQTFTYDPYGNLTQRQIVGLDPVVTPVETPNTNRLAAVAGHPYTYDDAGNLTADYNVMYAYDPFNMLREKDSGIYFSKSEFYIYTASDERIGVKYGNLIDTPTVWSIRDFSGNVLRQYEGYDQVPGMSWLWIEDYMYRDGQLLAGERVPEEGGRRHFHLDHLGSPRLVTGQDSKEMSEHDFDPFGLESNPQYQETAGGFDREDPKRFTGHERDYAAPGESPASTAYLDYMHARFYTPNAGRFLSVDRVLKVKGAMRSPQGWNRYAYVVNNPLRYTDPTGEYVCHGTTQECNNIEMSMNKMRFEAAQMTFADGRSQMQRVVDAYGKAGDATTKISGVWANPRKADGSQLLQPGELGRTGRGNVFVSLTNIGAKANGSSPVAFAILAGTLTHEGDHELQPAFMSLHIGERPSRLSLMYYEFQAYTLERAFYKMSDYPGLAPDPSTGAARSTDHDCLAAGCNP